MGETAPFPAILRLPLELRLQILASSSDVPSLRALALTCSTFYSAFVSAERPVTTAVLSRHIHPQVQHEAAVTLAASRLPAGDSYALAAFIDKYLRTRPAGRSPVAWSLSDALPAARFHTHVRFFVQTLSRQLLSQPPFATTARVWGHVGSGGDGSSAGAAAALALSATELQRFERVLYRFEMLCRLYTRHPGDDRFWGAWFPMLAKFEIEQLSCLCDLFACLVAPGFNDLVLHDVSWGCFRVELITHESFWEAQHVLSRGLATLRALVEAETFEQRCRILHGGDGRGDEPQAAAFLYQWLRRTPLLAESPAAIPADGATDNDTLGDDTTADDSAEEEEDADPRGALLSASQPLGALRPALRARILGAPFAPPAGLDDDYDHDPGPARLFELFHRDTARPNDLLDRAILRPHRQWGYVLWDAARLDRLGAFASPDSRYKLLTPADPFARYYKLAGSALQASRVRRTEIWCQGGSGWWSQDDESRVVRGRSRERTQPSPEEEGPMNQLLMSEENE